MTSSRLTETVDAWTIQAVVASRFLTSLYRGLGDNKQAAHAIQAGVPAEERARRLGLGAQIKTRQDLATMEATPEVSREFQAWQALVEAHAGVAAFHSMAEEGPSRKEGLQGTRSANTKAFQQALRGFGVAFPEAMAGEGIATALQVATDTSVETLLADLEEKAPQGDHSALAEELTREILGALREASGLKLGACTLNEPQPA